MTLATKVNRERWNSVILRSVTREKSCVTEWREAFFRPWNVRKS